MYMSIVIAAHSMPVRTLTFSPDGMLLLTGSDDKHMKIFDV